MLPDHAVVLPDPRGMRLSAAATDGFNRKNQAEGVAGIVDALNTRQIVAGFAELSQLRGPKMATTSEETVRGTGGVLFVRGWRTTGTPRAVVGLTENNSPGT